MCRLGGLVGMVQLFNVTENVFDEKGCTMFCFNEFVLCIFS